MTIRHMIATGVLASFLGLAGALAGGPAFAGDADIVEDPSTPPYTENAGGTDLSDSFVDEGTGGPFVAGADQASRSPDPDEALAIR